MSELKGNHKNNEQKGDKDLLHRFTLRRDIFHAPEL